MNPINRIDEMRHNDAMARAERTDMALDNNPTRMVTRSKAFLRTVEPKQVVVDTATLRHPFRCDLSELQRIEDALMTQLAHSACTVEEWDATLALRERVTDILNDLLPGRTR